MASNEKENVGGFGGTAIKLSYSPLGIIALFIVLVYGFASLVVGFGQNLTAESSLVLVLFMVLFPVLVLGVFSWLVSRHHAKLYAPRDYPNPEGFSETLRFYYAPPQGSEQASESPRKESIEAVAGSASVRSVPTGAVVPGCGIEGDEQTDLGTSEGRELFRTKIFEESNNIFLVHVLKPSKIPGQKYDIFIYIKKHDDKDISDVAKADFYFGKSWGYKIFPGTRQDKVIGVSTSAYGPFLCSCLVTFKDASKGKVLLYRYIDFEMGEAVSHLLQGA